VFSCLVAPGMFDFPEEKDWHEAFGGAFPYPRNGYYIPVSDEVKTVVIKKGVLPTNDLTYQLIGILLDQMKEKKTKEDQLKDYNQQYAESTEKRRAEYEYGIQSQATLGEGKPGEKSNFIIVP
jgi:hypothetical protein